LTGQILENFSGRRTDRYEIRCGRVLPAERNCSRNQILYQPEAFPFTINQVWRYGDLTVYWRLIQFPPARTQMFVSIQDKCIIPVALDDLVGAKFSSHTVEQSLSKPFGIMKTRPCLPF